MILQGKVALVTGGRNCRATAIAFGAAEQKLCSGRRDAEGEKPQSAKQALNAYTSIETSSLTSQESDKSF